jgi:dienelactone hydrolase
MNQLGISSELEIIEGAPHGFLKEQAWFKHAMEAAVAHFNRVLKGSSVSK